MPRYRQGAQSGCVVFLDGKDSSAFSLPEKERLIANLLHQSTDLRETTNMLLYRLVHSNDTYSLHRRESPRLAHIFLYSVPISSINR